MCQRQHVKVLEKLNEDVNVFLRAIYLSIICYCTNGAPVLEKKHLSNRKIFNNEQTLGRNHVVQQY